MSPGCACSYPAWGLSGRYVPKLTIVQEISAGQASRKGDDAGGRLEGGMSPAGARLTVGAVTQAPRPHT